jgi:hypothetical protein
VCSCHFRDGNKCAGPEIFDWNYDKIFPATEGAPKKKRKSILKENVEIQDIVALVNAQETKDSCEQKDNVPTAQVILEAELDMVKNELTECQENSNYQKNKYSVSTLNPDVIRMETGLPTIEVFNIVVNYALRFKDSITYYSGWRADSISFQDQVFITLMKLRQNYTNLHLISTIVFM